MMVTEESGAGAVKRKTNKSEVHNHNVEGAEVLSAHERSLAGTLGRLDANEGAVDAADHSGKGAVPKEAFFHGRLFFVVGKRTHPFRAPAFTIAWATCLMQSLTVDCAM